MVGDQKSSDSTPAKEEEKVKIEKIFLLLLLCLGRPAVTSSDERKKYRCPIYDADVHELSALCSNVKGRGWLEECASECEGRSYAHSGNQCNKHGNFSLRE